MIVDSSALMAILYDEDEASEFLMAIEAADEAIVSAGTMLEASIVVDGKGSVALSRRFDELVRTLSLRIEPVSTEQASIGRDAYREFGRGSGHDANLNFGDCFSYALAYATDQPLLFKGNDFGHTDLVPAV
jgi:ribonuclease VapC